MLKITLYYNQQIQGGTTVSSIFLIRGKNWLRKSSYEVKSCKLVSRIDYCFSGNGCAQYILAQFFV